MNKLRLQEVDVKGKKVLMRVDFNVPLDGQGTITDDTRIRESLPSIRHILQAGGSVILMSHLGRPTGKDPKFSLKPCAETLSQLLGQPVRMASDSVGEEVQTQARELNPGDVLLLENVRFYPAEENPSADPSFAKQLATLGDLYVNDAFGTAHRNHSSTAAIASFFPGKAAAGFLLQKEIEFLGNLVMNPARPFYAIIGGSKISSKMGVLKSLLTKVDALFIGGGMAFTFQKAQGIGIGSSIHEDNQLEEARALIAMCAQKKVTLYLPEDFVIADAFDAKAHIRSIAASQPIPPGWQGMDIGAKTLQTWIRVLGQAKTVFWNGPLGVFEMPPFAKGTMEMAKTLAELKATTIVGGGDSVAAINQLGLAPQFDHVSTGGGAALEYIEFGHLPGVDVLSDISF